MNVNTTTHLTGEHFARRAIALLGSSSTTAILTMALTLLISAIAYYFVGFDQGAVSVFGSDTHVHEFVHDARHFLGFPCH